jgi:thioesterase-3
MNPSKGYPNTTQVSHCLKFTASETEVDALGHLNNGVYIANLERARIAFYQHINLELESPPPKGLGTVVVNMNINFRRECFAGDHLQILTQAHSRGGRSYILSQTITRKDNEVVCDALVTNVIMDLNRRSVVDIPPALERIYQT